VIGTRISLGYFTAVSLFKPAQSCRGMFLISEAGPEKSKKKADQ